MAVSAGLWDKAGPLTDVEREKIRLHTYVGERVLSRATALTAVAEIASLAHERLDGSGYHRRLVAASCPPAARLLAAADVHRALVEERPHRPARTADEAAAEVSRMATAGQLCPEATRAILEAAGRSRARVDRVSGLDAGRLGDGQLNEPLELIRGNHRLPALAAVIFGPDGVLESGVVGMRALGHPEQIGADDQWHIGSLTKAMTATVAATLIERGQIGWKTTIAEVLTDIPMRQEYRSVTLTDLLTNSAGMATDGTRAPSWGSLTNSTLSLSDQRRLLAREYLAMAPVSPVGTFNYSNAGYLVVGAMLEQVTKTPWESLMAEQLFAPLQMTSAGFGPPSGSTELAEPWGHSILDDGFDKGAMGGSPLISAASYQILHTPAPGTIYACGWGVVARKWAGGRAYQHDGSNNFWYADVWLAPAKGFGVLTLTNGAGLRASTAANDTAVMLITRFNGEPPT